MARKRTEDAGITLDLLKTFVKLCEHHHFGKAAKALGISQPAVSQNLADLEGRLGGARLFERGPGRAAMSLTEAGFELHNRALRIMAQVETAETALRAMGRVPKDTVRIGITFDNRELVAEAIEAVIPKSSKHYVVLDEYNDIDVQQAVFDGRLHLGVVTGRDVAEELQTKPLAPARLYFISHPSGNGEPPTDAQVWDINGVWELEYLERQRLVLLRYGSARTLLEQIFTILDFLPRRAIETNRPDTALELVRNNPSLATILPLRPGTRLPGLTLVRLGLWRMPSVEDSVATRLVWPQQARLAEAPHRLAIALREKLASAAPLVPANHRDLWAPYNPTRSFY